MRCLRLLVEQQTILGFQIADVDDFFLFDDGSRLRLPASLLRWIYSGLLRDTGIHPAKCVLTFQIYVLFVRQWVSAPCTVRAAS